VTRLLSVKGAGRLQILLVVLCLFLFLSFLGNRALWDVDEGMHSVSAKHVLQSGDWVTPNYKGQPFLDKPMFFTWLVAISFGLLGYTEFAARLPAAVLGLSGVWVTYLLGRRMFHARTGFLGGAVLATSVLYLVMSRTVVHDIALAFFTTLALFFFYTGVAVPERRKESFLLFYVALAGGVLAKGPLGALLPAIVIGPYLLLTRRLALVRELRMGWGLLLLLGLSAPWYILMELRNEGYLSYFLIEKNFGSFASTESAHPAPFYLYVPLLLGALSPWTAFLPAAIYRALQRLGGEKREQFLYLLLWLGMMFLFFSAATSKLGSYLLPLMPAAALLIGLLWDEALASPSAKRPWVLFVSLVPIVLVTLGAFAYGWLEPPIELRVKYGITLSQLLVLGLLITVLPMVTLGLLWQSKVRAAFASIVTMAAAVLVVAASWMGPSVDPYRSTRDLALEFDRMLPPEEPMVFFKREKDSALFYTDRRALVLTPSEVGEFLESDHEVYFLADVRHLDRIAEHRDRFAFVRKKGSKVVISNRPEAEVPAAVPEAWRGSDPPVW